MSRRGGEPPTVSVRGLARIMFGRGGEPTAGSRDGLQCIDWATQPNYTLAVRLWGASEALVAGQRLIPLPVVPKGTALRKPTDSERTVYKPGEWSYPMAVHTAEREAHQLSLSSAGSGATAPDGACAAMERRVRWSARQGTARRRRHVRVLPQGTRYMAQAAGRSIATPSAALCFAELNSVGRGTRRAGAGVG